MAKSPDEDGSYEGGGLSVETMERSPLSGMAEVHSSDRPAREVLAEYWGSLWPEVQLALAEEGVDLDGDLSFPAWESVKADAMRKLTVLAPEYRDALLTSDVRYPEVLSADWVLSRFKFREPLPADLSVAENLTAIDEIASKYNWKIEGFSKQYADQLQWALEDLWEMDRIIRAPLSTRGAPSPYAEGKTLIDVAGNHGSWAIAISVEADQFPLLAQQKAQITRMRRARDAEIRTYLESLYLAAIGK